jgi:hypothetical protein
VILVLGNAVWVKLGKCDNGFAFDVFIASLWFDDETLVCIRLRVVAILM